MYGVETEESKQIEIIIHNNSNNIWLKTKTKTKTKCRGKRNGGKRRRRKSGKTVLRNSYDLIKIIRILKYEYTRYV